MTSSIESPPRQAVLTAAEEWAWLVDRGYEKTPALGFVSDARGLRNDEQGMLERGVCFEEQYRYRVLREADDDDLKKRVLRVDGLDLMWTLHAAAAGEPLLERLDGTLVPAAGERDDYQPDQRTPALWSTVLQAAKPLRLKAIRLFLPKSTVGDALAKVLVGSKKEPVELRQGDVEEALGTSSAVATGRPSILDGCASWLNLAPRACALLDTPPVKIRLQS